MCYQQSVENNTKIIKKRTLPNRCGLVQAVRAKGAKEGKNS